MNPRISIVVISRNEGEVLRQTVQNLQETAPPRTEILVVDDGSDDESTAFLKRHRSIRLLRTDGIGVARARNVGARQSTGEVLIFIDAHMRMGSKWWTRLVEIAADSVVGAVAPAVADMDNPRSSGYGLTFTGANLDVDWLPRKRREEPYAVPILPGCCLAMRRQAFEQASGFDGGLIGTGSVDNEMSVRLWLLGYELLVAPDVAVEHLFRETFPYPVRWRMQLRNRLRLAMVHFTAARCAVVTEALRSSENFDQAMADVTAGVELRQRRQWLRRRRVRTDDWLFERFCIDW